MTAPLPERKRTRLKGYDYSRAGVYFLTLCAAERRCLFAQVRAGGGVPDAPRVILTKYGMAVKERLEEMDRVYGYVALLKYVIMPNHVHILLQVTDGPSRTPAPAERDCANQTIPAFVSALKRMTNRVCGVPLWQRGYHDHIVRNEADYLRIWQYIDNNPSRWAEDKYFTQ